MERLISDFGPIYAETDVSQFPVEPWNASSTLIFLLIVLVFLRRTGGDHKRFPFTVVTLPILFIGFLGGAIYHATRSHWIWLTLDFSPIFILVLLASLYFWHSVLSSWWKSVFTVIFLFATSIGIRSMIEGSLTLKISAGYSLLAINILLPAFLHAANKNWAGIRYLLLAPIFFILAITFRYFDQSLSDSYLPMGTHFLWHLLGGGSVFVLMEYVFQSEKSAAPAEHIPVKDKSLV
jgi:hemolysin III